MPANGSIVLRTYHILYSVDGPISIGVYSVLVYVSEWIGKNITSKWAILVICLGIFGDSQFPM